MITMLDGNTMITYTNSESLKLFKRYVVARLDIYRSPGWFDIQTYDNYQDARIYCDMLNSDTNMIHRVFEVDE